MALLSPVTGLIFVGISLAAPAPAPASGSFLGIDIWRKRTSSSDHESSASAHIVRRNNNELKYEVAEIVGAYLFWLFLTGLVILLVGKRLRRKQQSSNRTLGMQMINKTSKPTLREIEAGPRSPMGPLSPKSPGKMLSLKSWAMGHNKSKQSDSSFSTLATKVDERVIDEDKSRNMDEMAKLYAAVMAHDEERGSNLARSSAGSSPIIDDGPVTPKSPSYPPEMAHPAYIPPGSPKSYPISHYEPMPPPPMPMENDEQQLLSDEPTPRKNKNAALSILSSTTSRFTSSTTPRGRPSPITVRGQPISKPLGSADLRQSAMSPSATSIASTVYTPGPPPPTPGRVPAPIAEEFEMHGRPQLTSLASSSSTKEVKPLPFRQYQDPLKSAPATKTTFLDRRTSAMNGPKTGVPKTPYSPYCPTTPMTPITPRRLLNKEEIKKNKKQYAMKVVAENDLVQSDNDMWGH